MVKKIIAHFVLVSFVLSQNVFAMDITEGTETRSHSTPVRLVGGTSQQDANRNEGASTPSTPSNTGTPSQVTPFPLARFQTPNGTPSRSQPTTLSQHLTCSDLSENDFSTMPTPPVRRPSFIDPKLDFGFSIAMGSLSAFSTFFALQGIFNSVTGLNPQKKNVLTAISVLFGVESLMQRVHYFSEKDEFSFDSNAGAKGVASVVLFSSVVNVGNIIYSGLDLLGLNPFSYISSYVHINLPSALSVSNINFLADGFIFLRNKMPWMKPFESSQQTPNIENLEWYIKWTEEAPPHKLNEFNQRLNEVESDKVSRLLAIVQKGEDYKAEFGSKTWFGQHADFLKNAGIIGVTTLVCVLAASVFKSKDLSNFNISDVKTTAQSGISGFTGTLISSVSFIKNLIEEAPKTTQPRVTVSTTIPASPSFSWMLLPLSIKAALSMENITDLLAEDKNLKHLLRAEAVALQKWMKSLNYSDVQRSMSRDPLKNLLFSTTTPQDETVEEDHKGEPVTQSAFEEEARKQNALKLAEEVKVLLQNTQNERIAEEEKAAREEEERIAEAEENSDDTSFIQSMDLNSPLPKKDNKVFSGLLYNDLFTDESATPNGKILSWDSSSDSGSNFSSSASTPIGTPQKGGYVSDN